DATVATPLIWPRWPFGMVRDMTSFAAREVKERPPANTASASKISTPAAVPLDVAAISAMAAAATACTADPATHTHLRCGRRLIQGANAACGSSEPDSLIGTRRPMKPTGAPREVNSHG